MLRRIIPKSSSSLPMNLTSNAAALCFEPLGTLQLRETTAKDPRLAVSFDRIGVVHPPLLEIFQGRRASPTVLQRRR